MNYPLYPAAPDRDPAEPFRNLDLAPSTRPVATIDPSPGAWEDMADPMTLTTDEVIERQRERFGGVKVGSAFFGWLTATATFAILSGIATAVGVVLGLDVRNPMLFARELPLDLQTVGWIGAGTLLVVLFAAYYCGGYVAGRMARFSGVAQGIAVWVWTIAIGIVIAVIGFVLGLFDEPVGRDLIGRIPLSDDLLTIAGIVAAVVVAVVSLGGAILGGVVGVRYHRRVDHVVDDE
ncbi:MAG TPA: hypothetical protein VFR16_00785 [Agromyces mariniharenae]|nr:hypothetical protein [Agromyces mariniharenae]